MSSLLPALQLSWRQGAVATLSYAFLLHACKLAWTFLLVVASLPLTFRLLCWRRHARWLRAPLSLASEAWLTCLMLH